MNRRVASLLQFARTRRTQTILDQVLVSGSNFMTGIVLVRGLGLVEFGRFTVAYAILLLANGVQLSFISSPMITLGSLCATPEERRQFVRGIFGVQMIFCAIATVASIAGAAIYVAFRHRDISGGFLLPFTAAVIAFLMQDWLRRYYFTIGKASASFWNDVVSYLGQVVVLCVLWGTHHLTMNTALWSIAVTSGAAFAMGGALERLGSTRAATADAWRRSHAISIDLGIANQLQWLVYQGAMLIGAGVIGAEAAGGVRATQNIIGPVNIAFQAMENIVPVRAAEEMRRGGIERASAFLFRFGAKGFVALLALLRGGRPVLEAVPVLLLRAPVTHLRGCARSADAVLSAHMADPPGHVPVPHHQEHAPNPAGVGCRRYREPGACLSRGAPLRRLRHHVCRGSWTVGQSRVSHLRVDADAYGECDDDGS